MNSVYIVCEMVGKIFAGLINIIVKTVITMINKKRVRAKMEPLEYTEFKQKRKNTYTRNMILNDKIILEIKEEDSSFNEKEFKEWAKETFIEFQKAWSTKNINAIRNRLDYDLCEQYNLLLKTNVKESQKEIIEVKQINYIDFSAYSKDNEKEIVEVALNAVTNNYTIDEETKSIISGSKTIKVRTTYKLKFYRKVGIAAKEKNGKVRCPNCGAEILNENNKCEYCKSIYLDGVKSWILNSIDKY